MIDRGHRLASSRQAELLGISRRTGAARCAMAEFLVTMAGVVLALVAVGLTRVLRGPSDADRMMAAQLLGTGSVAALLLLAAAVRQSALGR